MIPILPCRSLPEILDFYRALGFAVTFHQQRPNPYAVVERGDIELQFFSMKSYDPTQSYSTCYIVTTDVEALYAAFSSGLRAVLGKLPTRGLPRIGPLKDMSYGVRQFLLTDPGGNTLRVGQPLSDGFAHLQAPKERFARALQTAGLLVDSKEDTEAAARLLDRILASDTARSATEQVQALVLRAETALRMDERSLAERLLGQARTILLTDQDRQNIRDDLHRAEELAQALAQSPETPPSA
jgi:hypothetical protein